MESKSYKHLWRKVICSLLVILITSTSFLEFIPTSEASGVRTGSSGYYNAAGTKTGMAGGVSHIDRPVFRVGISRDTSFYTDGTRDARLNMASHWNYRYPKNDDSLFFTPNGFANLYNNYEVGKYDSGSRKMLQYSDLNSRRRVINLSSAPSSPPRNLGKEMLNEYSFGGSKTYDQLRGGKWKSMTVDILPQHSNAIWSYILAPVGSGYDVHNRMDRVISQYTSNFGTDRATPGQMEDIGRGYLGLLIMTWKIVPMDLRGPWERAIEDFITGKNQGKGEGASTLVIDTAMTLSFQATGKRLVVPTIDYFQYYTAVGKKYDLHNTTREIIAGSRVDTHDMMRRIVALDIRDNRSINRTSTNYNASNVFAFGASAIANPRHRFTTAGLDARWGSSSHATATMNILSFHHNPGTQITRGFMTSGFSLPIMPTVLVPPTETSPDPTNPPAGQEAGEYDFAFSASPKNKLIGSGQELIGEPVHLTFTSAYTPRILNTWNRIFRADEDVNQTVNVKIVPNRTANPTAQTPASYTSAQGDFTTGVDMSQRDFIDFIRGYRAIRMVDNTTIEPIAEDTTKVFTYRPKMEITYVLNGEEEVLVLDFQDYASFRRPPNPPEYIGYTSDPSAYSELKHERPDNEEFDAMSGVPSTKRLYLGVGGSEFVVDVELEYKQDVDSVWRTYRSHYTGVPSEHKAGDTWGGATVPSPSGASSSSLNVTHEGGTVTATWTGSLPWTGSVSYGDHFASVSNSWDYSPYDAAKAQAQAWASAVNAFTVTHTSSSDVLTRSFNGWGASITTDTASDGPAGWANAGQAEVMGTCGEAPNTRPCVTTPYVGATGADGSAGSYTITVTGRIPAHEICGPECTYDLPAVQDNWRQRINYDYMRISRAEVFKIEEGRLTRLEDLFGEGNSELKASIRQGNPNIFHNIAQQNANGNDTQAQSSRHGRLRYSLEESQHDTVVWYEGPRSNTSAGMGNNGNSNSPAPAGHNHPWATGILYNNPTATTEVDYHRARSGVNSAPSTTADSIDTQTPEWERFNERRTALNTATVISDMLILQTSSGDQSVLYFDIDSEEVQSQEQFPDVRVTKDEMWDDNPYSAVNWGEDEINIGSYNGNFRLTGTTASANRKYWGYNKQHETFINNSSASAKERVETRFDSNAAGVNATRYRPTRPSKLYMYQQQQIPITNENGSYRTGSSEVFYQRILDWRTPTPYEDFDGIDLRDSAFEAEVQPNFSNRRGITVDAPYSDNHDKTNDIVIHTPVSVQDAMLISLPRERDQRTETPSGGAGALIDEQNRMHHERDNQGTPNMFEPAIDKDITTVSKIYRVEERIIGSKYEERDEVVNFNYTGSVQTFTAPNDGVYTLEVWGAQGGSYVNVGGKGGYSKGDVQLQKGDTLRIYVGGRGGAGSTNPQSPGSGGWNGGGTGGHAGSSASGSGGGGATDIRRNGTALTNRIIVAGGGGGASSYAGGDRDGGAGGGLTGVETGDRSGSQGRGGGGGTQTAGGITSNSSYTGQAGSLGLGGNGYTGSAGGHGGGGGGGGYYGGGSGGTGANTSSSGGGGGGSGYIAGLNNATTTQDIRTGNGQARISFTAITEEAGDSTEKVYPPISSTSRTSMSTGDAHNFKGYTWEQLFGANWQDYIIVTTETSTRTTTVESDPQEIENDTKEDSTPIVPVEETFNHTGSIRIWTVPQTGTYKLETWGAEGSHSPANPNGSAKGAYAVSYVTLNQGEQIKILVGEKGRYARNAGGGGGGTFIATQGNIPLAVAGGGGGMEYDRSVNNLSHGQATQQGGVPSGSSTATVGGGGIGNSTSGAAGGGGFNSNGTSAMYGTPGRSFISGGARTVNTSDTLNDGGGGFGGGASTHGNSGGGGGAGGYTGGGGGNHTTPGSGGGGGSYHIGVNSLAIAGFNSMPRPTGGTMAGNSGHGIAKITLEGSSNYTVVEGEPTTFNFTGNVQTYTAPANGVYSLEVWGAEGGSRGAVGGKGGYAKGNIELTKGQTVYVYVGGGPTSGWNGGQPHPANSNLYSGGGTDIRTTQNTTYANRVIVAGGGGSAGTSGRPGGDGGGLEGVSRTESFGTGGGGGTQTAGGIGGNAGTFGVGGRGIAQSDGFGGSGGGGWYGGGGTRPDGSLDDDRGGGGGSGYIGGVTDGTMSTGVRSGHGLATITPIAIDNPRNRTIVYSRTEVTTTEVTTTTRVDEEAVQRDLASFPDRMPDGSWNPVKLGYGSGAPVPPSPVDTPVTTTNGNLLNLGTFINIDYPFRIYYPNQGDFAQQPTMRGIGTITTTRGSGYVNNMDTTEYTLEKYVQFGFNVIYEGELYTEGSWISLPVEQEYFDFYAVLANYEQMSSEINFEAIPVNGQPVESPVNENYQFVTNKNRFADYSAYHGSFKRSYVDVVGRIGNFAVSDTEDFRFSNLFKQPVCDSNCTSQDWLIEGLVKVVDSSRQRNFYGDLYDIRGESFLSTGVGLNTHGTQTWLTNLPYALPINPRDHEVPALKEQFLKAGYDIFADISTIGNYQDGVIRVLPYYYKLDVQTGAITPLDVYQKNGESYLPVNRYTAADNGEIPPDIHPYSAIIDWENESQRRNYTLDEHLVTNRVAEIYGEYEYGMLDAEGEVEEGVTGIVRMTTPRGNFVGVGNSQRGVADNGARTFIGSTRTYNQNKNLGDTISEESWNFASQRWHLKFGLPASSVFVPAGRPPTSENIDAVKEGTGVVLMAADIISIGNTYSLRWDQPGINSFTVEKDGITRTFNIASSGLPPVIALYDVDTTAVIDVDVKSTH